MAKYNMIEYNYLPLRVIRQYEPEMERLGVSEVARSPKGFLPIYKRAGGNTSKLSEAWRVKRHGFIKRHLAQYKANPTYRRLLALRAWAYEPK